ncbi:D-glucuronyl C5-epimerase C-terminus [Brevibacterium casei]|uniref:D-glucuronyl C5-epimerase C-terminus n=1 Tax=Brevibacterium casei TaxID=33889 RepID=A0A449DAY7_9MICO|nr:D-glucuronyl C5-epimerase family protein [Brevibacterium casei]VEW14732.1 D-glucuronyl C5-epimerase C-terminus [Brevibacterium casei]
MTSNKEYITNENEVGFPPLQSSRKAVWNYYRIEFLKDGYPGRRTGDELFAHPIYGPYVIADYVHQYRVTKQEAYLNAAKTVADAAIEHMTEVGNGLAFVYSQNKTNVSSKKGVWYSGLTQARYIDVFNKLLKFPDTERFREPLSKILSSLEVPVSDGGVADTANNGGLIIEEYPSLAPDCTLNGWTTATVILRDFARSNHDEQAQDLFDRSVKGLESLIPVYDVPEYATSRYRLKGPAVIYLRARNADLVVNSVQVDMRDAGILDANLELDPGGSALAAGPRQVKAGKEQSFTVDLTRRTFPTQNTVMFSISSSGEGFVEASIGDSAFNPMSNKVVPESKNTLGEFRVSEGTQVIEVSVPWIKAELIAYPTNFGKAIAGRQFNQYHWIHVDTLGKIAKDSESDLLSYYRDRWEGYPEKWVEISEYQDDRITLERFDPKKHK